MDTILALLCFVLGLMVLIIVHELGHFLAAKLFNVYCFEFSIAFGKKVIRRKAKYAETYFCLGVIPLGGYVSMLGEDVDETEKNKKQNAVSDKSLNDNLIVMEGEENKEETPNSGELQTFTVINKKTYKLFKKQNRLLKKEISKISKDSNLKKVYKIEELSAELKLSEKDTIRKIALENVLKKLNLAKEISEQDFYSVVDENNLPKDRDLEHINRGKKFIIMSAGIIMNFIIGYLLYFISYACFPNIAISLRLNPIENAPETSMAYQLNEYNDELNDENFTYVLNGDYVMFEEDFWNANFVLRYSLGTASVDIDDEQSSLIYTSVMANNAFNLSNLSLDDQLYSTINEKTYYNFYEINVSNDLQSWETFKKENEDKINANEKIVQFFDEYQDKLSSIKLISNKRIQETIEKDLLSASLELPLIKAKINESSDQGFDVDPNEENIKVLTGNLVIKKETGRLESTYLDFVAHERWLGVEAFSYASKDWAKGTTLVFNAVGNLFVGKGWESVGGPIALLTQSSNIFKNNPFSVYVRMWGLISVNLAVMNLLPFPGLDGWHLLVTVVEATTRRKINAKFKRYASFIGMMLLFALMAVIFIFDIVRCSTGVI